MKLYKEIEIKDIKGVKYNRICNRNLEKVCRYMETIKRNGIKKPFEIIQKENGYYIFRDEARLVAAKAVGYDKVPCLIRDIKQEILLRKINKIFKIVPILIIKLMKYIAVPTYGIKLIIYKIVIPKSPSK